MPRRLLPIAFVLALAVSALLYPTLQTQEIFPGADAALGINVPICVALTYIAYFLVSKKKKQWHRVALPLLVTLPLALSFALFSVEELLLVNFMALLVLLPLHFRLMEEESWHIGGESHWISVVIGETLKRPLCYIGAVWRTAFAKGRRGAARPFLLACAGVIVCLPVLALVVVLLIFADARFADIVERIYISGDSWQLVFILCLSLLLLFPFSGWLYTYGAGEEITPVTEAKPRTTLPAMAAYAALVLFNIVLGVFAALQIERLLLPLSLEARMLSEATHETFFPMVAAALLCYGVQALSMRYVRREGRGILLRVLLTLMAASLLIMMLSAFQSVIVYQQSFGLTRLRIYVTVCIVTLFLLLAFTLLRIWRPIPFRAVAGVIVCLSLLCVNYCNVDRSIAAYNLELWQKEGIESNAEYLLRLSDDALPVCLENFDKIPAGKVRAEIWERARNCKTLAEEPRLWHYSRQAAAKFVE